MRDVIIKHVFSILTRLDLNQSAQLEKFDEAWIIITLSHTDIRIQNYRTFPGSFPIFTRDNIIDGLHFHNSVL